MTRKEDDTRPAPASSGGDRPDTGNGETADSEKTGFGARLKKERERKGLSRRQVFEATRIRPHILEALEAEDWDALPSRVFVSGFVRTYARFLGLEESDMAARYHALAPAERPPEERFGVPARRRRAARVFLIVLLAATAAACLLWWSPPGSETPPTRPTPRPAAEKPPQKAPVATPVVGAPGRPVPPAAGEKPVAPEKPAETGERPVQAAGPVASGAKTPPRILKIHVREKTWIRIRVDSGEPREYLFSPGSNARWEADRGFNVIIGNAAGVELEFDGKKMDRLGPRGQVVRLKLPDNVPAE